MDDLKDKMPNPEIEWPEPIANPHCVSLLHKFRAPLTRYYQKLLEDEEQFHYSIQTNLTFDLRFYFPADVVQTGEKVHHLIIMFNGLDEFLPDHLSVYNRLGLEFALRNTASVLFPTPFHLNRAATLKPGHEMTVDNKRRPLLKKPSDELFRNPFWVYVNFIQTLHEYAKFKSLLSVRFFNKISAVSSGSVEIDGHEENDRQFYEQHFSEDLSISLLGYSLGGLKALTCFRDNPDIPKSCILLNSGSTIDRIRLKGIMDRDRWRSVTDSIVSEQYPSETLQSLIDHDPRWTPSNKAINRAIDLLREVRNDDKYAEVRKVLVGTRPFNERDRQVLSRKLVLVIGGRDKIIPPEEIRRLEPEGSSLNVLHISELGHFPDDDAAFNRWCVPTVDLLVKFIGAPEGTSLSKSQVCSLLFAYDWLCDGTLISKIEDTPKAQQYLRAKFNEFTEVDNVAKEAALRGFNHTLVAWRFNVPNLDKRVKELKRQRKKKALRFGDVVKRQFGYDGSAEKEIEKLIDGKSDGQKTGDILTTEGYISDKLVKNVLKIQGEAYRDLMEEFPEGREWVAPIIKAKLATLSSFCPSP